MEIITPKEHVGTLMELSQGRRGDFIDMQFLTETRTTLIYELPLANVCSCNLPLMLHTCVCVSTATWQQSGNGAVVILDHLPSYHLKGTLSSSERHALIIWKAHPLVSWKGTL